jgi:ring-1,2-phenylacetyl-CoA epoxidase subunit PaaA
MFGPSDAESVNSAQSSKWRIKLFSNDELRQRMVDQTVPQIAYLGLTVPDPDLKFNADTGHYEFGAIDWSEFHNVLKGNGPCNRERLQTRVKAWDDGAWFRDALGAYADKQADKKARAA